MLLNYTQALPTSAAGHRLGANKGVLFFDYETWNQLGMYSEYRIK